jgi:hypothetical protein
MAVQAFRNLIPSELLAPLVDEIRKHVILASKIHADDTPVPVLAPGNGKTKSGRLWTYVRDDRPAGYSTAPAVWFAYSEDRKGEHPRRHLKDFKGALQADEYSGFRHLYGDGAIYEVSCWAHSRRKFHDCFTLCRVLSGRVAHLVSSISRRDYDESPYSRYWLGRYSRSVVGHHLLRLRLMRGEVQRPDVERTPPVGDEGDEFSVGRDGRVRFGSFESVSRAKCAWESGFWTVGRNRLARVHTPNPATSIAANTHGSQP